MGFVATAGKTSTVEPLPPDTYPGRCIGLIDLGTQPGYTWQGETTGPKRKILLEWELPTELLTEGEHVGKPRILSREFTLSIHENSNLGKFLVNWRGKKFTKEEAAGFSVLAVLGAPCLLGVGINDKGYNTVASIQPYSVKLMGPAAAQVTPTVTFDFDLWRSGDPAHNAMYAAFPDWIQAKINGALEVTVGAASPASPAPPDIQQDDIPF